MWFSAGGFFWLVGWLIAFWWFFFFVRLFNLGVNNYFRGTLTLSAPGVGMRRGGIDNHEEGGET